MALDDAHHLTVAVRRANTARCEAAISAGKHLEEGVDVWPRASTSLAGRTVGDTAAASIDEVRRSSGRSCDDEKKLDQRCTLSEMAACARPWWVAALRGISAAWSILRLLTRACAGQLRSTLQTTSACLQPVVRQDGLALRELRSCCNQLVFPTTAPIGARRPTATSTAPTATAIRPRTYFSPAAVRAIRRGPSTVEFAVHGAITRRADIDRF